MYVINLYTLCLIGNLALFCLIIFAWGNVAITSRPDFQLAFSTSLCQTTSAFLESACFLANAYNFSLNTITIVTLSASYNRFKMKTGLNQQKKLGFFGTKNIKMSWQITN